MTKIGPRSKNYGHKKTKSED